MVKRCYQDSNNNHYVIEEEIFNEWLKNNPDMFDFIWEVEEVVELKTFEEVEEKLNLWKNDENCILKFSNRVGDYKGKKFYTDKCGNCFLMEEEMFEKWIRNNPEAKGYIQEVNNKILTLEQAEEELMTNYIWIEL